jgi:hypothetical protein
MDRRRFVKKSLAVVGGPLLPETGAWNLARAGDHPASVELPPGKLTIQYIRSEIPHFEIPAYRGRRYQDTVPDTLDIAERSKLCIHALTSITDPNADMEVYWLASFNRNPPVMQHDFNDWVANVEGLKEALPLLRISTGSSENDHVDPVWMNVALKEIGPDGMVYIPMKGRPWSHISLPKSYVTPYWRTDGTSAPDLDLDVAQVTHPTACQRMLGTMALYYARDKNPMWKATIEKMIQRLEALAVDKGEYAYWPRGGLEPFGRYGAGAPMPTGFRGEETSGRVIMGLAQYYRVTGYEPARMLSAKLANYLRFHAGYFQPDGPWLFGDPEREWWTERWHIEHIVNGGHGHAHGIGLLSALEYATVVGDQELMQFVRASYEWARANCASVMGFFPEAFVPDYPRCEADTIADMLSLALKLSVAGAGDYWDDADRWTRNHFSESQIVDPTWIYRVAGTLPPTPVAFNETGDHVPERSVGSFAGWSAPNDFNIYDAKDFPHSIQHCCTGNMGRTLYYLWEHQVHFHKGELRVNLLLNRASAWADIHSHIPYQGKVEVKVRTPLRSVMVRMPEWVISKGPGITAQTNGRTIEFHWEGRYLNLGSARPGDVIAVSFPIPRRQSKVTIGAVDYTLDIKGNTIINIDPPGQNGPFYQRSYYLAEEAPKRKVERFVPEDPVAW